MKFENRTFVAIANPDRRRLLDMLIVRERPAGELAEAFPELPQPAVSRHLRVLRQAGLVTVTPHAQKRIYSLRPEGLMDVDKWVSHYREFWTGRLDSLEGHLERMRSGSGQKEKR